MPTYRYECEACGHGFELFQSMTAKLKRKCPECGKTRLVRLIGAGAGVIFKGSGFYQTDYKGGGKSQGADSGGDGKDKVASGDTDSKPSAESSKATPKAEPKPEPKPDPRKGTKQDS